MMDRHPAGKKLNNHIYNQYILNLQGKKVLGLLAKHLLVLFKTMHLIRRLEEELRKRKKE